MAGADHRRSLKSNAGNACSYQNLPMDRCNRESQEGGLIPAIRQDRTEPPLTAVHSADLGWRLGSSNPPTMRRILNFRGKRQCRLCRRGCRTRMLFLDKMQVLREDRTSHASLRRWNRHRSGPRKTMGSSDDAPVNPDGSPQPSSREKSSLVHCWLRLIKAAPLTIHMVNGQPNTGGARPCADDHHKEPRQFMTRGAHHIIHT